MMFAGKARLAVLPRGLRNEMLRHVHKQVLADWPLRKDTSLEAQTTLAMGLQPQARVLAPLRPSSDRHASYSLTCYQTSVFSIGSV